MLIYLLSENKLCQSRSKLIFTRISGHQVKYYIATAIAVLYFKVELIHRERCTTRQSAKGATLEYFEILQSNKKTFGYRK